MAEAKVNNNKNLWYIAWALILVGAAFAASEAMKPKEPVFTGKLVPMDGHRTGVQSVTLENDSTALGTFTDEGYLTPSGVLYADDSSVAQVAATLMEQQPRLAELKTVVGHSAAMLMDDRDNPDLPLGNLVTDAMRSYGSRYFKVPMDLAMINFGGIRTPLPKGAVTLEDVKSMFPFNNYLCFARIKGSSLIELFEQLSGTKAFLAVSGATVRVKEHKLEHALVGGKEINPDKLYNLVTLDFLLDGGDNVYIGALSQSVKLSHVLIRDVWLDYVQATEKAGKVMEGASDGRVIMED